MFDLDLKDPDKIARGDEICLGIIHEIVERSVRRLALTRERIPKPRIYSGTRPDKYSKHVIFDIWLASPYNVSALLHGIPEVDMLPYGGPNTQHATTMRLPYSEKLDVAYPILPEGEVRHARAPRWPRVSPAQLCRGTITWIAEEGSPLAKWLPAPETIHQVAEMIPQTIRASSPGALSTSVLEQAKKVMEYLNMTRGPFIVSPFKPSPTGGWTCYVTPGLYCDAQGRKHHSQKTYIGSEDNRRVYYRCPDVDCKLLVFFSEDFTALTYGDMP
jgi:hypothetical protein